MYNCTTWCLNTDTGSSGGSILLIDNNSVHQKVFLSPALSVSLRIMAAAKAKAHMTKDDVCCCKLCYLLFCRVKESINGAIYSGNKNHPQSSITPTSHSRKTSPLPAALYLHQQAVCQLFVLLMKCQRKYGVKDPTVLFWPSQILVECCIDMSSGGQTHGPVFIFISSEHVPINRW